MQTWYVYIIATERSHYYAGITTDLARRFQEHCDTHEGRTGAKGAKFFRLQKPVAIVYSRSFGSRAEASRHEREIKSLSRAKKEMLLSL
jgi:putative endonuclease